MPMRIGVVTALTAEAKAFLAEASICDHRDGSASIKVVRWDGIEIGCLVSGMGRAQAYAAARSLIEAGARLLVSAGVAGGLDPRLSCGDAVLADRILRTGDDRAREGDWQALCPGSPQAGPLSARTHGAPAPDGFSLSDTTPARRLARGLLACVDQPVLAAKDKAALHARTRALAVDMESAGVALAAQESAIPVASLKVISDTADRELPKAVAAVIDQRGELRPAALIARIARHPTLIPAITRLARDFHRARETLQALGLPLTAALGHQFRDRIRDSI